MKNLLNTLFFVLSPTPGLVMRHGALVANCLVQRLPTRHQRRGW